MQNTSVKNHSYQAGSAYCQIEANTVNVVLLSKQVHQLLAEICRLLLTSYQRHAWVLSWIKIKGNNQVCINFCSDPDLPLKKIVCAVSQLQHTGSSLCHVRSFIMLHGPSSCGSRVQLLCGMWGSQFPDQGLNPCPLHCKADS